MYEIFVEMRYPACPQMSDENLVVIALVPLFPNGINPSDRYRIAFSRLRRRTSKLKRTRILLVESQIGIGSVVSDLLEQMGCSVMGSHCSVSGAREIASITRPDVVLMDLRLRRDTSVAFGDELARQGISVAYLVDSQNELNALQATGRRGVLKPLELRRLRSVIAEIISQPLQVA
ncbi:response regulator [Aestuariibius sp. 2305UL40-4]|uniref:response regulator n=1 Tax=Aestuariibius violaceus TaxID=3234132 RepID=UPI003487E95D